VTATTRSPALAAVLALAACAATAPPRVAARAPTQTPKPAPAAPAKPGAAVPLPPPPGEPSAKTLKSFDEIAQAQAKAIEGGRPDWAAIERRWRGILAEAEIPEARFNLGVALAEQGRDAEARTEYERALQAKPSLRQAAVNLAAQAEARGDTAGAAAAYARVLRDFPEDALARERLAALYLGTGQLDEASRLAKEALLRDPRSVGANKVLAKAAVGRKEYDLARLVAKRTEKLAPQDPELPYIAGDAFARQGDAAAAAAQWRRALALDPGHLPSRYALLGQAVQAEQWGQVAEHAQGILLVRPDDARVVLARGIALRHLDQPDEALAAYDRADKLAGGNLPEVRLARGILLARVKSECEPAIVELNAYVKAAGALAPANSPATKLIRDCEAQLEENRKALEAAKAMQADAAKKPAADPARKDGGAAPPPPPPPPAPEAPRKP